MLKKRKIVGWTVFCCLLSVFALCFSVFAENPRAISGRCLSPANSKEIGFSDSSKWIEIAKTDDYSLILREEPLIFQKSISDSSPKKCIIDWFESLKSDNPLKSFAVGNKIQECTSSSSSSQDDKSSISFPLEDSVKSAILLSFKETNLYKTSKVVSENAGNFLVKPAIWVKSTIFGGDSPSFVSVTKYTQKEFDAQKSLIYSLRAKNPDDPKLAIEKARAQEIKASSAWSNTEHFPDKKNWEFARKEWEKSAELWVAAGNIEKNKTALVFAKTAEANSVEIDAMCGIKKWSDVELIYRNVSEKWREAGDVAESKKAEAKAITAGAENSYINLIKTIPFRKYEIRGVIDKFYEAKKAWKAIDSKQEQLMAERINYLTSRLQEKSSNSSKNTCKSPETKDQSKVDSSLCSFARYPNSAEFMPSKYMDDQTDRGWCWIVAVQGMFNKNFGIYDPVEDMFYLYFGKYPITYGDENDHGATTNAIGYLAHRLLDRYGMYEHYSRVMTIPIRDKINMEKIFLDISEKYGAFVSNCCSSKNHVILIVNFNKSTKKLTIENWGTNYTMPFNDFYDQCVKTYGDGKSIDIIFIVREASRKVTVYDAEDETEEFLMLYKDTC